MRSPALRKERPRDLEGGRLSRCDVRRVQGVWASARSGASDASSVRWMRTSRARKSAHSWGGHARSLAESRREFDTCADDRVSSAASVRSLSSATLAYVHERRSAPWLRELTAGAPELHGRGSGRFAAAVQRGSSGSSRASTRHRRLGIGRRSGTVVTFDALLRVMQGGSGTHRRRTAGRDVSPPAPGCVHAAGQLTFGFRSTNMPLGLALTDPSVQLVEVGRAVVVAALGSGWRSRCPRERTRTARRTKCANRVRRRGREGERDRWRSPSRGGSGPELTFEQDLFEGQPRDLEHERRPRPSARDGCGEGPV